MSIKNLRSLFQVELKNAQKKWSADFLPDDDTLVEFTLGGKNAFKDFVTSTGRIVDVLIGKDLFGNITPVNNVQEWEKASVTVLSRYAKTKRIGTFTGLKTFQQSKKLPIKAGVYMNAPINSIRSKGGLPIVIYGLGAAKGNQYIDSFYDSFTRDVWKQWVKANGKFLKQNLGKSISNPDLKFTRPASGAAGKRGATRNTTIIKTFRTGAKREHGRDTTTASQAVRDLGDQLDKGLYGASPDITYNGIKLKTFEILEFIENNISANWDLTPVKKGIGKYSAKNVITLSLGKNPTNLATDLKNIMKNAEEGIRDIIQRTMPAKMADPNFENSPSLNDQVGGDVITDVLRPLTKAGLPDMRYKVNVQEFKKKKRRGKLKRPKGISNAAMLTTSVAVKGKKPQKVTPEKRKEKGATELLKLESMINKRLPAEVRRNMGRPALINQTGVFSNSVEAQNFRETPAGISGEFTYQLSPYETFENTGSRRWPTGYNPKPLIAKSIRNLAMQYTSEKLASLRRT